MLVELTEKERDLVVSLIDREIGDLGPEIHHTMTAEFRDELKENKHILREIKERLGAMSSR